jgi:hypothetical protein
VKQVILVGLVRGSLAGGKADKPDWLFFPHLGKEFHSSVIYFLCNISGGKQAFLVGVFFKFAGDQCDSNYADIGLVCPDSGSYCLR